MSNCAGKILPCHTNAGRTLALATGSSKKRQLFAHLQRAADPVDLIGFTKPGGDIQRACRIHIQQPDCAGILVLAHPLGNANGVCGTFCKTRLPCVRVSTAGAAVGLAGGGPAVALAGMAANTAAKHQRFSSLK
jgi:hypothetical protein